MWQSAEQAEQERRQFAAWLRTGRLSDGRLGPDGLGQGPRSAEFKFNPWHDPADGRFTWANSGRFWGAGSAAPAREGPKPVAGSAVTDNGSYDGPEIVVQAPRRGFGRDRVWPVAGNGAPAQRGARSSNGRPYADGRFSRAGRYRIDARTGKHRPHMGVDLPGEPGDPVVSAADGIVIHVRLANASKDFGNNVIIRHPNGTTTGYAHLQSITVAEGQAVRAGQQVGTIGNTGNAGNMGTHLHFEVAPPGSQALTKGTRRSDPTHWIETGEHQ